ncbi:MAG: hypothetical protein WC551_05720 [Patescibacteria group bacterium]
MGYRIIEGKGFLVQPKDINTEQHFWDAFGNSETEVSARYIVRLCQRKCAWLPFHRAEIEALYQEGGYRGFEFNWLVEPGLSFSIVHGNTRVGGGWIVLGEDGLYRVTDDFILRCYKSSPMPFPNDYISPPAT